MQTTVACKGYIGMMEKKRETTIMGYIEIIGKTYTLDPKPNDNCAEEAIPWSLHTQKFLISPR